MKRTLSEQKVLKKLGIPDFRHMTKDKVVQFASLLPKMDPEVAKLAFEQFPEFAKTVTEMVAYYKDIVNKAFDENNASVNSFYAMCDSINATLSEQLKDDTLSFEEKTIIIDKMIELAQMKADKDSENKKFILDVIKTVALGLGVAVGAVAAALGAQASIGSGSSDNEDDDDLDIVGAVIIFVPYPRICASADIF